MPRTAPTPGRIVWFNNGGQRNRLPTIDADQPMAAQVAFVHADGTVNLAVTDHFGLIWQREKVPLLQEDDDKPADGGAWCCWMPYQVAQARKQDAPPVPIVDGKPSPVIEGTGFAAAAGNVAKDMADQANGPGVVEADTGAAVDEGPGANDAAAGTVEVSKG